MGSEDVRMCMVCLEDDVCLPLACCAGQSCHSCMTQHVAIQISCAGHHLVSCPFCDHNLPEENIVRFMSEKTRRLYDKLKLASQLRPNQRMCPKCDAVFTLDGGGGGGGSTGSSKSSGQSQAAAAAIHTNQSHSEDAQSQSKDGSQTRAKEASQSNQTVAVTCGSCGFEWCFRCVAPLHPGLTCKQYQKPDDKFVQWKNVTDEDKNPNAQLCPKCLIYIQRDGGCTHMKCTRCKTDFCYRCGRQFNFSLCYRVLVGDHYDKFSIVGCPSLLYPDSSAFKRTAVRLLVCSGKRLVAIPLVVLLLAVVVLLVPIVLVILVPVVCCVCCATGIDRLQRGRVRDNPA